MAIFRDGERWRVQVEMGVTLDGKRSRKSRICATKREATRVERELLSEAAIHSGRHDRITLARFIDEVWWPLKRESLRAVTLRGYERDIRLRIKPRLGNVRISDISRIHIQQLLTSCPTYKTAKNTRDTLRNILNYAVDLELIPRNPAAGSVRLPEREIEPEQHNGAWLTTFEEHARFLEAVRGDLVEPIVVIGLCFGLRKGEILGLDWSDIDFEQREITVRRTYI